MKNKFILLLLLAAIGLPFGGFSQEYVPFVDTTKDWNVTNTGYSAIGSVATINTMKLHISSSDTIINDTAYYKVINTGQYNFFSCPRASLDLSVRIQPGEKFISGKAPMLFTPPNRQTPL